MLAVGLVTVPSATAAVPRCLGSASTIRGNNNANTLNGTSVRNVIVGLGGNDVINGGGGNDLICGGLGNDRISGGSGTDRISCGGGRDAVTADWIDAVSSDCEVVRRINHTPKNIALSKSSVDENKPIATVVGAITTSDVDPGDRFVYRLVLGEGGTDNAKFKVSGSTLITNAAFDHESRSQYNIRLRVDDRGGASFEKAFVILVNDLNEAPKTLTLSSTTINENLAPHTLVGTLGSTDLDEGDTVTFSLVAGTGSTDNDSFEVIGDELWANAQFNREPVPTRSIRLRATDNHGAFFDKVVTITIGNVNEAPTSVSLDDANIEENAPAGTAVGNLVTDDPDVGDSHTFVLVAGTGSTDNGLFAVNGGVLETTSAFNFETPPTDFTVRVRATDGAGLTAESAIAIHVVDVNEAPTNLTLSSSTIAENVPLGTTVGTLTGVDPDAAGASAFSLVAGTGDDDNGSFQVVGNALKVNAGIDFETGSTYSVRVQVGDGSLSFAKAFTITVTNVNEAPTDITLSSSTVAESASPGTTVGSLTGVDPDAAGASTFTLVAGTGSTDNASFQIVAGVLKTNAVLDFESRSSYSIRVRVSDGSLTFDKVFSISVTNVNEAPTDITLSSSSVAENATSGTTVGTLTGVDPDGAGASTFTLVAGTGSTDNASFQVVGNVLRTSAVFDFETDSSYSVRVRVTDGSGLFVEKVFAISVTNVNEAPTDITLSNSTVAENAVSGTTVGTLTGVDPDAAGASTFSLVAGTGSTDNASFQIVSGVLKSNAVFDFETDGSYSVRVRVADGSGLFVEKAFAITVTNVNEAPTDITLSNSTVAENAVSGTTLGTLTGVDPDAAGASTFSLVAGTGSTDNASFQIVGNALKTNAVFNFEAGSSYSVRVRVSDGSLTFDKVFAITVTNVNEAPTNITLSSSTVAENVSSGTTVGTLTGVDPDAAGASSFSLVVGTGDDDNASFQVVGSSLRTNGPIDFEAGSPLSVRVRVSDGALTLDKVFAITVTNVNEAPTDITLSNSTVAENAASGATVGTLTGVDPDAAGASTFTLVSGSGSGDNGSFQIVSGVLKTNAVFNFEVDSSYSIRVRVSDGTFTVDKVFAITVTNVNEAPTNITLSSSTVAENVATGTTVGTLTGVDPDAAGASTFSLVIGTGDDDNASFQVVGNALKTNGQIDFEAGSPLSVRLRVSDGSLTFDKVFAITVTNVNEAPTDISLSNAAVDENLPADTEVGTLGSTDPDAGGSRTYTLVAGVGDDDNSSFDISGTSLTTTESFDFETKDSYTIRIRVTDQGGLTYEEQLTVTVGDVVD